MNIKRFLTSLGLAGMIVAGGYDCAYAVPAKQGLIPYEMPDGTIVGIRLFGDETFHYATTEDGYVIKADENNVLRYMIPVDGKLTMTDVRVTNISDRDASTKSMLDGYDKTVAESILKSEAKQAREAAPRMESPRRAGTNEKGSSFPSEGSPKVLVILAEYSDVKFSTPNPHEAFTRLMSEAGYNDGGATGSALDYFSTSSNNQFTPEFDVYGPVTLPHNRAYYGAQSGSTHDVRAAEMIRDACQLLDSEIDYSQYDTDNDGCVDNVYVFYAGNGQADTNISDAIWPHAWYVYSGGRLYLKCDGKLIDRYACSGELSRVWRGGSVKDVITGIGTFVHEFSHVMGLMDHYTTDYNECFTPGAWDVMDQGSYNNDQRTPPLHTAYERFVLGWLNPTVLEDAANITLKPASVDYNSAYRITTNRDTEYYILENRQQTGWDKYIPGHGMLIWHIFYNSSVWWQNGVNNDPHRQRVDIEEADGTQSEATRASDAFPGTKKVTAFTDDTNPSMITWGNIRLNKPVTDIRESNGTIYFLFKGGVIEESTSMNLLPTTNMTAETATLNWTAVDGVDEYFVDVESPDGTKIVNRASVEGTSYNVSGLTCETKYRYMVYYRSGDFYAGKVDEFETPFGTVDYHAVNVLEASNIKDTSFTANWDALQGAESYSVTLYGTKVIPPTTAVCDFTGKALPEGWSTNSKSFVETLAGYFGESAPSLVFMNEGAYLDTPVMDNPIKSVEFGSRGRQNGASKVDVCIPGADGEWQVVENVAPTKDSWKTYTVNISDKYPEVYQVRLLHNKGSMSNLVIDDVKVITNEKIELMPMADRTDMAAGSGTSFVVGNLNAGTCYYYSVKAHQGNRVSRESNKVKVTTSGVSGIDEVGADGSDYCRVAGDMIEVFTAEAANVEIYTVSGILLVRDYKESGSASYPVNGNGVYVVKIGDKAHKLVK